MRSINIVKYIFFTILLINLSACSYYKFPWVYRIDVEQGNVLEEDELSQVKVGMTKSQVKFLLGSPLVQDTFNQQRWDYYYSLRTGKGQFDRKRVTLKFNGDKLTSIDKKEYETRHLKY